MSDLTIKQAIVQFYQRNDFGEDGGVTPPVVWLKLGPVPVFPIFNLASRRKALRMHDIHHIVMGFETTWKGETAVSAWEVASGGWGRLWYVWFIVLSGMAGGVILFPRNTYSAFKMGLTMRNAYVCGLSETEMLDMDKDTLRNRWATKVSTGRDFFFWAILSLLVGAIPIIALTIIWWVIC